MFRFVIKPVGRHSVLWSDERDAMKCRDWKPLIAGYVAGDLDGTKAEQVEAHLEACGRCRRELNDSRRLSRMFIDPEQAPTSLRERIFGVQGKVEMPAKVPLVFAGFMILAAIVLWLQTPNSGLATHERMKTAVARATTLHLTTSTLNAQTGRWEPLETWVGYGCFRRGSRYHVRRLQGTNGVASYDPKLGHYTAVWHPTKGAYVPSGALVASNSPPPELERRSELITVESLLKAELPWHEPSIVMDDVMPWQGKRAISLTIEEDRTGERTRTMLVLDPQTHLPMFAEVTRQVGGHWRPVAKTKYDFDAELPQEMFTIESLQHSYASEVAFIR